MYNPYIGTTPWGQPIIQCSTVPFFQGTSVAAIVQAKSRPICSDGTIDPAYITNVVQGGFLGCSIEEDLIKRGCTSEQAQKALAGYLSCSSPTTSPSRTPLMSRVGRFFSRLIS